MVRSANAALDAGGIKKDDVPPLLSVLEKFDEVFAVLDDDDVPKMKQVLRLGYDRGQRKRHQRGTAGGGAVGSTLRRDIEKKIAEMESARKARNFKVSDALRAELTAAGIVIENTKDGVRWRRK